MQIVWTKRAQQHMERAYKYIASESPQNAKKVKDDITRCVEKSAVALYDTLQINIRKITTVPTGHLQNIASRCLIVPMGKLVRILGIRHSSRKPIYL
jgi:plasmid stabilization system protein ParE